MKAFIVLAIETAMRRGEIVNLNWQDINLDSRLAYLHETKNGTSRTVPLSTRAVAALLSLPRKDQGRVVTIHRDNISAAFAVACDTCEINGLTLHDLRHEATSRLFEKGFNMMIEQVDRLSRLDAEDWVSLKRELQVRKVRVVALDLPTSWMMTSTTDEMTARMMDALNGDDARYVGCNRPEGLHGPP